MTSLEMELETWVMMETVRALALMLMDATVTKETDVEMDPIADMKRNMRV